MKKSKTNFGVQTIILCVALLIALPVRIYQYLHLIDGTSGFYNTWVNPTVFGLYGLCLLVIVLLICLSLKGRENTLYAMPAGKHMGLGIASLAFALSFLAEGVLNLYRVYQIATGSIPVQQLVIGDNAGKATLAFTAVQALFGLLSAVFFIIFGISYLGGKEQYKKVGLLAAAPTLWAVGRLMNGFAQTISYRYVSELLFELFMVIFFAMFAIAFAKMCAGVLKARIQMRLFAYGALSTFFALLSAVPRYVMLLMGRQDLLYRQISAYEVTDLVIPIFVMIFIFAVAATKQYKSVEEYGAEAPEEGEEGAAE
ncbi:MAG: hypothetical protein IJI67_00700 [Clostridia bacterium]|nr:hypothetical protein [Clostridia bacterium]